MAIGVAAAMLARRVRAVMNFILIQGDWSSIFVGCGVVLVAGCLWMAMELVRVYQSREISLFLYPNTRSIIVC
jgi:hypothetical protein